MGAKRSLKKPTEEKSSVRACAGSRKPRAVSSKQPDTSGKIPEVTYPASLGYVNSNDAEVEVSLLGVMPSYSDGQSDGQV